ncbi:hypothetical protein BgiBS90_021988, partial [Biomphalaria glabrata]
MQMGAFDLMPRKTAAIYLSTGSIANSSGGSNTPRTSSSSSGHAGHHYGELWRSKNFSFGPRSPRSISSSSLEDRLSTASPSLRSYSPCLNTSKLPHGRVELSDVRPKDRLFLSGELLVPDSEGSLYDGRLFYSSEYLFPGHRHHLRTRPYASFLDSDTQGIEEKRSLQGIVASEEELTLSTIFQ